MTTSFTLLVLEIRHVSAGGSVNFGTTFNFPPARSDERDCPARAVPVHRAAEPMAPQIEKR